MSNRNVLLILVAVVMMSTACQPTAKRVEPLSHKDVETIHALAASIDKTVLAMDWDAFVALMTEDIVMMFPNSPAIQGGDAFKAWIESLGAETAIEHELEFFDVDGYGDIAYVRGTYTEAFTLRGVAKPIEDNGNVLLILRKQPDGSWRVSIWMHNSELPLPVQGSDTEHSSEA